MVPHYELMRMGTEPISMPLKVEGGSAWEDAEAKEWGRLSVQMKVLNAACRHSGG